MNILASSTRSLDGVTSSKRTLLHVSREGLEKAYFDYMSAACYVRSHSFAFCPSLIMDDCCNGHMLKIGCSVSY